MPGKNKIQSEHNMATSAAETELKAGDVTMESVYRELSQLKSYLAALSLSAGKRIYNNKTLSEYIGVSVRGLAQAETPPVTRQRLL